MTSLPKQYDHKEAEKRWQKQWEADGIYRWDPSKPREQTYVIDTPPPTVSGILHMGHIFSYTQADFVARYQRMAGKTVFYPMGFDDNGLPTERLVEKTKKVRATDMSREDFIKLCEEVAEEARTEFRRLFTSVALSVDWTQEYHTISEHCRRISQLSFLDLLKKGHAYRKLQPMFWDPVDQTAIAQAEIEDKEMASYFNDIYFEVVDESGKPLSEKEFGGRKLKDDSEQTALVWRNGKSYIVIGTTRPELIPACVAIFFHPDDKRYAGLKGKTAITPLFGVKVKIMTDETVEIDKGTGIMMCCTFGDEADIKKWRDHDLPVRIILNKFGKVDANLLQEACHSGQAQRDPESQDSSLRWNDIVDALANLKVSNPDPKHPGARQKVLEMLAASGDLIESRPITHAVKCAERSGAPLEILPTYQWFVKVLDKKEALHKKAEECTWYPPYMQVRMDQWIDGLSWDWCISRQRYFGVPFPVWYVRKFQSNDEWKTVVADAKNLPVNPLSKLHSSFMKVSGASTDPIDPTTQYCVATEDVFDVHGELVAKGDNSTFYEVKAEPDVMDTWATSSVSPQISSHGISSAYCDDLTRHAKLFPADLRPQAHEIIRTWAFYTVVKAMLHEDTIPWSNLMISGWCLAADKTKMSKSKGNVITPVDLIEEKGADVVRYWASTSRLGADTAYSEDVLKIGKKLVTKLWNASNFAGIHLDKIKQSPKSAAQESEIIVEPLDKWILSRLHKAVRKATEEFDRYEYSDARVAIEDFFWNDFCDNYLELVKARAYGEGEISEQAQRSAHHTIYHCLETILRLFAPIVPHVTDEIYSHLFKAKHDPIKSINALGNWPNFADYPVDETSEKAGIACVNLLNAVRKAKSERNVSIKYPLTRIEIAAKDTSINLEGILADLKSAANAAEIVVTANPTGDAVTTEDGAHHLSLTFAEQGEAA